MSFEELLKIAPPISPAIDAGTAGRWANVEKQLGTPLPDDYKRLINTYGLGVFGNYITPLSPFMQKHHFHNLITAVPSISNSYETNRLEIPNGYPPYPMRIEQGGLLPWARDDNAGLVCWLINGQPHEWHVIVLDDHYSEIYYEYRVSAVGFLCGWLTGQIRPDCYPPDVYPFHEPLFRLEIDDALSELNASLLD